MGNDTKQRSSRLGFEPAMLCHASEPMYYEPRPLGQWAPQSSVYLILYEDLQICEL